MSTFAGSLVDAASSAASAYLQFIQESPTGEFVGFIFVEDKPDISVYRHLVPAGLKIAFYPCGGKAGVVDVYDKLTATGKAENICFIVDRDIEELPYTRNDILRTQMYSWESHLAEVDAVKFISEKKCHPAWMAQPLDDLAANWSKTLENFKAIFAQHTALLKVTSKIAGDYDVSKIPIIKGATFVDGVLSPGEDVQVWLNNKADVVIAAGVSAAELGEITAEYYAVGSLIIARGKTLFALLRRFLSLSYTLNGKEFLGDVGDAVRLMEALPTDWPSLSYVREYVVGRLP